MTTPAVRGRDAELGVVDDALDRAASGAGAVVVVEGGPGLGKSRLLAEAARRARRRGFGVGVGVAEIGDSMVEMAALMDALTGGREPLFERSALPDEQARPRQRYWLLEDLQALLERAALASPLLLALDDLQWADSGTAAALRVLPERLASLPIAWLLARRPDPRAPGGDATIRLGPLDDDAVARVVADAMGATPDPALLTLARRAQGNPFLLAELLAGLREEELVRIAGERAELVEERVPRRVHESMGKRLARLPEPARQTVTVAAALGRRFSVDELSDMLGLPPAALLGAIEELTRADLLVAVDDRLALRHDLIREAVRESVPISARRALDRQAADVLLARGALPAEVATQLMRGAEPGDERAVATLLHAAEGLATNDPGTAADLGRRALELAPRRHALRGPLVARTAVWLHAALRGDEATTFVDTALRHVLPAEQEAEVRLSIARMFGLSPDQRVDAGRQALELPDLSPSMRARHLSALTYNLLAGGRVGEALPVHAEARAAARAAGDPGDALPLLFIDGCLAFVAGRLREALATFDAALRAEHDGEHDALERVVVWWRCEALAVLGRRAEALEVAGAAIAAARREHQAWALRLFEIWRGRHLLYQGQLGDAAASLTELFDPIAEARVVYPPDAAGVVALGRIALHTGDERRGRETAAAAEAMLAQTAPGVRRHGAWLLALQAYASGDPAGALSHLRALGEAERLWILPLFPMDITDEAALVRIAVAAGDPELAERGASNAEARAALNPGVRCLAAGAAYARGLLTGDADALATAAALSEGEQRPLALAAVTEDLGAALAARGATREGVAALDRALVVFARAGATADAARVRARLRGLGVRRRLAASARPARGWAGMTDSELTVARLVAQGMTNREVAERLFVSPHTVNGHLRQVFAKLGITSRVELTRLAVEHEAGAAGPV